MREKRPKEMQMNCQEGEIYFLIITGWGVRLKNTIERLEEQIH